MPSNHHIQFRVQPMLATLVAEPFDKPGWVYEEKYDGDRLLAYKEDARVRLLSRNGKDNTGRFPEIAAAIEKLRPSTLLLDGEVVVFDRKRVSRFQLLQQGKGEPVYAVFDCLFADGKDLRHEPLSTRREALEKVISSKGVLLLSHRLASNGLEAYKIAKRSGYEGLVAKDLSSPYVQKRSKFWLKVKVHQEDEFVIAGYTAPEGSRKYFGALLLGAYEDGKLRYVGKVGTGFDEKTLAELHKKFQPAVRAKPALADPPRERGVTYLEPHFVAQISYQELTADRKLRQPVYLGLRDDKRARDVTLPEASA
ncbi:MAG TPA: non-homologous end-joining DNA ligase [Candidatus Limnocylindrales bacterium]|nr:non-homologous end-joining DNA ligase [Candidatus Limnocylindrales bacterium]